MSKPLVAWFEIPVRQLDRAQVFYETLLATPLRRQQMGDNELAVFLYADGATGGCLLSGPKAPAPATDGAVVYLSVQPTLDSGLRRALEAGAAVIVEPVTLPGDMGCYAHIRDCEGNRIGLHADQ
jgi:predicted enzyme related to lactoylglutathione lyase